MIPPHDRLRMELRAPNDPMFAERLRRLARLGWLGARATILHALGLWRDRRRTPAPSRIARLLVIRTDRIGDMALTTPALADLRAHFRRAEITVLAPPAPLALLEGHPAVDRRLPLGPGGLPPEVAGRFDLAIDFTPDEALRGALLCRRSRAPFRAGLASWGRQACFTLRGPRAAADRHIVDLNRDLLAALGVPARPERPRLYLGPEESGAAQARLAALGAAAPRIAVHPGGHYPSQRWAPEHFAELIALVTGRLGAACIVLSGPGEEGLAARITAATPDALPAGTTTVRSMMALLASCDLFVGNNSGPLHVAGALGVPTVSVMGPTDPARFAPRGPDDRVVRRPPACSPCGRGRCWHHTCLRTIGPEEVLAQVEAALRERPARREAQ